MRWQDPGSRRGLGAAHTSASSPTSASIQGQEAQQERLRRLHHAEALRFYGVELTTVEGVSTGALSVLMSEFGTRDQILKAFPTAGHFCAWLGLCPDNRITGGKVLGSKTRKNANRLSTCLRIVAQALTRAKGPWGSTVGA